MECYVQARYANEVYRLVYSGGCEHDLRKEVIRNNFQTIFIRI